MVRVATSLGFAFDRQRGSHAVYLRAADGRRRPPTAADGRRVVIPMHGTSDLKPGTLRGLIADMGLTPQQFAALL